jgi:hypothetical protein
VVVLLSKFIGSTFKSALDRIAAVTLANVIGQLLYVLLGWCTLGGRIMTGIFIFLVVLPNMHVAFSGGTYASLGIRLAAISAMWLLTPCSDEYITKSQYADQYHGISDIVVGATIILMVDVIFGGEPPSAQARNALIEALDMFQSTVEDFAKGNPSGSDMDSRLEDVQKKIDVAVSLSGEAAQEPRIWRHKWRPSLYTAVTSSLTELAKTLHVLCNLTMAQKDEAIQLKEILVSMSSYSSVLAQLESNVGFVVALSKFILRLKSPEDKVGLSNVLHQSQLLALELPLEDLVKEMNSKPESADSQIMMRLSMVVESLTSMKDEMKTLERRAVVSKRV